MTEQVVIERMKFITRGAGPTVPNAKFAAYCNVQALFEKHKRLGQVIFIETIDISVDFKEDFKLYLAILIIDYEIVE